jgi:uncharacterized protein YjiS (DUF1127 family)
MSTITVFGQASASTRQVHSFITGFCKALKERRSRAKVRAALYALNGRDLHDIGIAHGDIEYVASHPDIDPRGT